MKIPDERLKALAEEIKQEKEEAREIKRMLSDDDYFEKYWEQNKIGNSRGCIASIVRMSTYGDEPIFHKQLIPGKWNYDCHDKRVPVVMRGSLWYMQNRGCSKSANTEELVERFFRFKKWRIG